MLYIIQNFNIKCIQCDIVLRQIQPYRWQVARDIQLQINDYPLHIPTGFWTDLASVPRCLWNLIPPFGSYTLPAIVHDFCYATQIVSRKTADDLFYRLMIYTKTKPYKAFVMYMAVRLFGQSAYENYNETAALVRQKYNLKRIVEL